MRIIFAITFLLLTAVGFAKPTLLTTNTTQLSAPKRILFVAPHPDDEILGMGAEIWKAQHSSGVDYRVVIMTCGDAYTEAFDKWKELKQAQDLNGDGEINYLDFGIARHSESLAALASLGVPAEKVIFLGYPDGGLEKLPETDFPAYLSPFTNTNHVPYIFAYHVGAPYTSESVIYDLETIINDFDPSLVYSTTPTDTHADHAFTRVYLSEAIKRLRKPRTHLEYLVHWEKNMIGWPFTTTTWQQPAGHIPADVEVKLSKIGLDSAVKASAIKLYTTQTNIEGNYLAMFAKDSEIFWNSRAKLSDYLINTNH